MSRMTSRGVKCSPAVSFESSANLRMSSSKTAPQLGVRDGVGVEIDPGEFLRHEVEEISLRQSIDLRVKIEALEDVAHGGSERLDVGAQVLADIVLIAHQRLHVEGRGVVEIDAGLLEKERFRIQPRLFPCRGFRQDRRLRGFEHAIQSPQHGERQDHFAVLGLLIVSPQKIGDGPNEGREVGLVRSAAARRRTVLGRRHRLRLGRALVPARLPGLFSFRHRVLRRLPPGLAVGAMMCHGE
jgi:hypothetical protein